MKEAVRGGPWKEAIDQDDITNSANHVTRESQFTVGSGALVLVVLIFLNQGEEQEGPFPTH